MDEAAEEGRAKLMGEDTGDSDWEHIVVVGLFGYGLKTEWSLTGELIR